MTIDLNKLQALADACFIGPWRAETWTVECDHEDDCGYDHEVETVLSPDYPGEQVVVQVDDKIHTPGMDCFARPHAEFIAACRDAVPALIARIRELESVNELAGRVLRMLVGTDVSILVQVETEPDRSSDNAASSEEEARRP